jgi:hypothetical protein
MKQTRQAVHAFKESILLRCLYGMTSHEDQSSWSNCISETKSKWQSPCSKCMHWPVTSQADACTSQAYACMYCMHCPLMSQADACSYCFGSVVLILSQIYLDLYLQLLCMKTILISLQLWIILFRWRHKKTFLKPK